MRLTTLICATALLTGCAGMNSEFEHNTPAKDSGFWLQQADEMTEKGNNGQASVTVGSSSYIDVKQYKLINMANLRLPVKVIPQEMDENGQFPSHNEVRASIDHAARYEAYDGTCASRRCYAEPNSPSRNQDKVSRVWLAPYLSPDNNVHLGEIVYFISKPSGWAGIENGGK